MHGLEARERSAERHWMCVTPTGSPFSSSESQTNSGTRNELHFGFLTVGDSPRSAGILPGRLHSNPRAFCRDVFSQSSRAFCRKSSSLLDSVGGRFTEHSSHCSSSSSSSSPTVLLRHVYIISPSCFTRCPCPISDNGCGAYTHSGGRMEFPLGIPRARPPR